MSECIFLFQNVIAEGGGGRAISVICIFLKSVICEKAENKSMTCDRGIVCDL